MTSGVPCRGGAEGQGATGRHGWHRCLQGADLHEGAVEERPLGNDEVGAEAAGNDLASTEHDPKITQGTYI